MSRGQRPRQPGYFPRMKRRGTRRRIRRMFRTIPGAPWVIWRDPADAPISKETR